MHKRGGKIEVMKTRFPVHNIDLKFRIVPALVQFLAFFLRRLAFSLATLSGFSAIPSFAGRLSRVCRFRRFGGRIAF
jgi:hypothetical protein